MINAKYKLIILITVFLFTGCSAVTLAEPDPPSEREQPLIEATVPLVSLDALSTEEIEPTVVAPTAVNLTATLPEIVLPTAVFIVDAEDDQFASARTIVELTAVYQRVNVIWAQANIRIDVQTIEPLVMPEPIVRSIFFGDFNPFFDNVGRTFDVPNASLINGFYAQQIGGPNGIVPFRSRVFFVTDQPSVYDERVTAHEIGHILGLHHVLTDDERLMFSGTNGMMLNEEEIAVARYAAQGILSGVR